MKDASWMLQSVWSHVIHPTFVHTCGLSPVRKRSPMKPQDLAPASNGRKHGSVLPENRGGGSLGRKHGSILPVRQLIKRA